MTGLLYLGAGAAGAALSAGMTPLAARLASRWGLVDLPNPRKIHKTPTPRIGGLAIGLSTFLAIGLLFLVANPWRDSALVSQTQIVTVLAAAAGILLLGLFDDILDVPARYKLLALITGAVVVCAAGIRINAFSVVGHTFHLGWLDWPLSLLWIVGITVSINFIDGLDGLAAGICAIAAFVTAMVAIHLGQVVVPIISLALAGSLVGFLIYNFHPARIFMGDCGSLFIGFLLSTSMLMEARNASTMTGMVLPALAMSVPLLDTALTLVRRSVIHRRSLFAAEREHVHHRLIAIGLCQTHAVLVLYGVSILAACVGVITRLGSGWEGAAGLLLLIPLLVGVFRVSGSTRARETLAAVRRNRFISSESSRYRKAFEDLQLRFSTAANFTDWWNNVCEAAHRLDFVSIKLALTRRDGEIHLVRWSREDALPANAELLDAAVPVPQRRSGAPLRAEVSIAAVTSLESAGYRVTLFSRLMGEHGLDRLPQEHPREHRRPSGVVAAPTNTVGPKRSWRLRRQRPVLVSQANAGTTKRVINVAQPRVAIVHDFLYTYAGAERVLEQLLELYPDAELYSLFDFVPPGSRDFLKGKSVTTSFIQRLPFARRFHRMYLPLMPLAVEQLDVSAFDIVVSSSYLAAKGVLTRSDQLHVCYCHTPVRFAWDLQKQYLHETGLARGVMSVMARLVLHYIRNWDVRSANNVDVFVTNSRFVGHRIEKIYRRSSTAIYPPVDTERFCVDGPKESFYLAASRMVPYKRIDLIVEAFSTRMQDRRLIVVGEGPDFEKIRAKAGPNVRLVGHQTFERLRQYMQMARAFVFAAEEDFGITPVEAQACGTPVIAFGRGGVAESVIDGRTGVLFHEQSIDAMVEAIEKFESQSHWDSAAIRRNAERFSAERFRNRFSDLVRGHWLAFVASRMGVAAATEDALAKITPDLRAPESPDASDDHEMSFASEVPA
jgi:UDP-N-acetylmuramyl pentapeptide phosphotransferase/UDP-N-acetylglucosamine-1-phosphate transferase/glycosyltransferase involved in cell wall biosynthesis